MKKAVLALIACALASVGFSAAQVPPKGKVITMPSATGCPGNENISTTAVPPKGMAVPLSSAADGPGIDELGRSNVSRLTFGLARIEARMDRLSDRHPAEFRVAYYSKNRRICITVTSRKMKATRENCRKLIGIVKKDAGFSDWGMPTRYAYYFATAGGRAANIDSHFEIRATIDNSISTRSLDIPRKTTCAGDLKPPG